MFKRCEAMSRSVFYKKCNPEAVIFIVDFIFLNDRLFIGFILVVYYYF